jgi:hypothetical protein
VWTWRLPPLPLLPPPPQGSPPSAPLASTVSTASTAVSDVVTGDDASQVCGSPQEASRQMPDGVLGAVGAVGADTAVTVVVSGERSLKTPSAEQRATGVTGDAADAEGDLRDGQAPTKDLICHDGVAPPLLPSSIGSSQTGDVCPVCGQSDWRPGVISRHCRSCGYHDGPTLQDLQRLGESVDQGQGQCSGGNGASREGQPKHKT